MASIKEEYQQILLNDKHLWDYYGTSIEATKRNLLFDIFDYDPYYRFIDNILRKGKKNDTSKELLSPLPVNRLQHTVSCFLLGIIIYNSFDTLQKSIDKQISKIRKNELNEENNKRFLYLWMLACLFHDLGYTIEERIINYDYSEARKELNKINTKPLNHIKIFSKRLIQNYLQYRLEIFHFIDHGIVGCTLLYKKMCSLRESMEKIYGRQNEGLYWGKEIENDFLLASWIIASHNIFKIGTNDESVPLYKHYNLDELIKDGKLFTKDDHPLLFLLCLVDSIEPIKLLKDIGLLEKIDLSFCKTGITISAAQIGDIQRCKYLGKLLSLNNWLTDVKITDTSASITL